MIKISGKTNTDNGFGNFDISSFNKKKKKKKVFFFNKGRNSKIAEFVVSVGLSTFPTYLYHFVKFTKIYHIYIYIYTHTQNQKKIMSRALLITLLGEKKWSYHFEIHLDVILFIEV